LPRKCYPVKVLKKVCEADPAVSCKIDADCQDAGLPGCAIAAFLGEYRLSVVDPLDQEPRLYDIERVLRLCLPTEAENEGLLSPDQNLLCYAARLAEKGPKHVKVRSVFVHDRFGPSPVNLNLLRKKELCLPSTVRTIP